MIHRDESYQKTLDSIAIELFGHPAKDDECLVCGSKKVKPEDFKDDLCRREFEITNMCQRCQDEIFDYMKNCENMDYGDYIDEEEKAF